MISLPNLKIYILPGELHSLFPPNMICGKIDPVLDLLAISPTSRSHAYSLLRYHIP